MTSASQGVALGLVLALAACAPVPTSRPAEPTPRATPSTTPPSSSAKRMVDGEGDVPTPGFHPSPASPAAAPSSLADPVAAVRRALEARAKGDLQAAKAALDDAKLEVDADGLRADLPILRARGGLSAVAIEGVRGGGIATVFFDASTGVPTSITAQNVFIADPAEAPHARAAGIFVGSVHAPDLKRSLYDARSATVLAEGQNILVSKDGARAYVEADDACTWQDWDLLQGKYLGDLERVVADSCPRSHTPRVTGDGEALFGGTWWDLGTRRIHRVGDRPMTFRGYAGAISDDERYVAYIEGTSTPSDAIVGPLQLVVVDRVAGTRTVASERLHYLSNGTPITFAADPARIVVVDYTQWAFALPGLSLLAKSPPLSDGRVDPLFTPVYTPRADPEPASAEETAPLRAMLERAACSRGGIPVPRDLCDPG